MKGLTRALKTLINDTHWENYAACADADPELFEPLTKAEAGLAIKNTGNHFRPESIDRVQVALSYCDVCPVWKLCVVKNANYVDEYSPMGSIYGRQYVTVEEARYRRYRARIREGMSANGMRNRVRRIPRPRKRRQRVEDEAA